MSEDKDKITDTGASHEGVVDPITGAKTTGHVWDDNIQEFSNPLPTWWIWCFYATVIFAIVYWTLFPSWPMGFLDKGFTTGVKSITYKNEQNQDETTHWNMRSLLAYEQQTDELELKRKAMVKTVAATSFDEIAADADKLQFVQSYGKGIFGDYCAGCHQTGGQGVIGHYPNLIDDAWLWGGDAADIEATIRNGRTGLMPSHRETLSSREVDQSAHYVLSLSGEEHDAAKAEAGKNVFATKGCSGCHGSDAKGMKALGSANLTDKIWTVAKVPAVGSSDEKLEEVKHVIANGIQREMPAWQSRLSDDEIKILVAYLRSLSANDAN